MIRQLLLTLVVGMFAMAVASSPAVADTVGNPGVVAAVAIYTTDSDDQGLQVANLLLDEGGGVTQVYRWGGSKCSVSPLLLDQERDLLAIVGNKKLKVTPQWKAGTGSTRCLVAYVISGKKHTGPIP